MAGLAGDSGGGGCAGHVQGGEAVEEGPLGEHHGEVGGEAGHDGFFQWGYQRAPNCWRSSSMASACKG